MLITLCLLGLENKLHRRAWNAKIPQTSQQNMLSSLGDFFSIRSLLFDSHALREVARLVDVGAAMAGDVVGEELYRDGGE